MTKRKTGRKPRPVPLHTYRVPLDTAELSVITDRLTAGGMVPSRWCALAVSQAHGYAALTSTRSGAEVADRFDVDLVRTAVSGEELRAFTAALTADSISVRRVDGPTLMVRLDKPLADRINPLCERLEVPYGAYLRAVIRHAVGLAPETRSTQLAQEACAV